MISQNSGLIITYIISQSLLIRNLRWFIWVFRLEISNDVAIKGLTGISVTRRLVWGWKTH